MEILPLHPDSGQASQEITYIQVGPGSELAGERVDLFLESGPTWRSDLLHDLHESSLSGDLATFPVFCRDGVFWTSKLLLASVSKGGFIYFTLTSNEIQDVLASLGLPLLERNK